MRDGRRSVQWRKGKPGPHREHREQHQGLQAVFVRTCGTHDAVSDYVGVVGRTLFRHEHSPLLVWFVHQTACPHLVADPELSPLRHLPNVRHTLVNDVIR